MLPRQFSQQFDWKKIKGSSKINSLIGLTILNSSRSKFFFGARFLKTYMAIHYLISVLMGGLLHRIVIVLYLYDFYFLLFSLHFAGLTFCFFGIFSFSIIINEEFCFLFYIYIEVLNLKSVYQT